MQGYQIALIVLGAVLLLAAVLVVRGIWENRSPQLTRCEVRCKGLAAASVPGNVVQGIFGLIAAGAVYAILDRSRAMARI